MIGASGEDFHLFLFSSVFFFSFLLSHVYGHGCNDGTLG